MSKHITKPVITMFGQKTIIYFHMGGLAMPVMFRPVC